MKQSIRPKVTALAGVGLVACMFELRAGQRDLQILPAGRFRAIDGRPEEVPSGWYVDAVIAAHIIEQTKALVNPLVIDYEHQTLKAAENGKPAPAAGWFKNLEWREGSGLWATGVEWTEGVQEMIAKGEYKFFSPVFRYDKKTGVVTALLMGAITNYPAIDGMAALAARAEVDLDQSQQETPKMKALLILLGLKEDATEAEALAALQAILEAKKTNEEALAAARAEAEKPDPTKFVPVSAVTKLQEEVASLSAAVVGRDVQEVVDKAITEGRLLPALKEWATDLGKKDIAALRAYVEKAQPIAALSGTQSGGQGGGKDKDKDALTEDELAVCRSMGLSEDEYKKNRPVTA